MRSILLSIVLASLPLVAAAEPAETHCYAGTNKITMAGNTETSQLIVSRTLDPAASQMREEVWTSKDPSKSKSMTAKVDAKAGTFEFDETGIGAHGTGILTGGTPWHWTGQTTTLKKGNIESVTKSTRDGDHVTVQATVTRDGKPFVTMTGDAMAFDCAKLTDRVAALAKSK